MSASILVPGRRAFLGAFGAVALFTTRGLFAEELVQTTATTEGPFYPDRMPLDTDNDLLIINDAITPAVGDITWLTGRVLTTSGQPLRNAFVEIWQTDNKASYIHTRGRNTEFDGNFQGYGRHLTDSSGRYTFRTLKPIAYTLQGAFRAPHIHVAVSQNGRRIFTTQVGIKGHKDNATDMVYRSLGSKGLETILVDFKPVPGSRVGELTASFDLVLGRTAAEGDDGALKGIGKPLGRRRG
jgi:protocatechuate 3,4-dioxygenase beta subunit